MDKSSLVEVYSSRDAYEARLVCGRLEDAGIQSRIVSEGLQATFGSLTPGRTIAPSIWVFQEDEQRAREILATLPTSHEQAELPTWTCPACGEEVEDSFEICWNCQCPRSDA